MVVPSVPANVRLLSTVNDFAIVPPVTENPVGFGVKVKPLILPKFTTVGEPEPIIVPEAVKAGRVKPVLTTVPLIVGAVRVLFVSVSELVLPTNVSVTVGSVNIVPSVPENANELLA